MQCGDVGMVLTGGCKKIGIVLKNHSTYYKLYLPTLTHRRKKIKRVVKSRLQFPKGYFNNRQIHIQQCQKYLTCVLDQKLQTMHFLSV